MKSDLQIKSLLALIALALLMNALNPWLLPKPALAASTQADLPMMEVHLRNMDSYLEAVEGNVGRMVELLERDDPSQTECVWTMIDDGPTPQIGRDGATDLSPDWEEVSQAGWTLKAVHDNAFIFERCR